MVVRADGSLSMEPDDADEGYQEPAATLASLALVMTNHERARRYGRHWKKVARKRGLRKRALRKLAAMRLLSPMNLSSSELGSSKTAVPRLSSALRTPPATPAVKQKDPSSTGGRVGQPEKSDDTKALHEKVDRLEAKLDSLLNILGRGEEAAVGSSFPYPIVKTSQ
eukprot:SAG31_NODE_15153_length_767_cov_1.615269_1_plen_167_part_00